MLPTPNELDAPGLWLARSTSACLSDRPLDRERTGSRSMGVGECVFGAGVMGAGSRRSTATAGYETVCYDVDAEALEHAARARDHRSVRLRAWRRARQADAATTPTPRWRACRSRRRSTRRRAVDLVVEAVPEKLELKQQVFRDLDAAAPAGTILASNTSGFPIAQIADVTTRPELVVGWHWASPPAVMRLAEIVRSDDTSDATVRRSSTSRLRAARTRSSSPTRRTAWGFVANRVYVRDDPRGQPGGRRGHRHARAGRHADGRLLPLAGRPVRHGAGRDDGWGSSRSGIAGRWVGCPPGRLAEPAPHATDGLVA